MPEYRAINKNLVDVRTVQIIERVWLKCKCPKFRCDDAIQKAKRKHGTTKGERGSYMLKNDSGKYTTHKYGSIHATRIRGHWDWRGINKELALGCVWMFAIGRRNFGSRSCREGGGSNRDWSPTDLVCIYFPSVFECPFIIICTLTCIALIASGFHKVKSNNFCPSSKFLLNFLKISDIIRKWLEYAEFLRQILQIDLLLNFIFHSICRNIFSAFFKLYLFWWFGASPDIYSRVHYVAKFDYWSFFFFYDQS